MGGTLDLTTRNRLRTQRAAVARLRRKLPAGDVARALADAVLELVDLALHEPRELADDEDEAGDELAASRS